MIRIFIAHHFRLSDFTGSGLALQELNFKILKDGKHT